MNIFFRPTKTKNYSNSDRKYLIFEPISLENSNESFFISATANESTIDSPLHKIINYYEYDFKNILNVCLRFNIYEDEILIYYPPVVPKRKLPPLILVKQTYGKLNYINYLMESLINKVNKNYIYSPNIHFTHYSLIFDKLPKEELTIIFDILLSYSKKSNINNFYIDIDAEHFEEAIALFKDLSNNQAVNIINS